MTHQKSSYKKGISTAEIAVGIIVLGVFFAALIPIFTRAQKHSRNTQRIKDIQTISNQIKQYYAKNNEYPQTLKDISDAGLGKVPKDPSGQRYCTGRQRYNTGDYQYYMCKDCFAVGPFKDHYMKHIVQLGALMEREQKRGEKNVGNRGAAYSIDEKTDCRANAIRGAGALLEGDKGNWFSGTGVTNLDTSKMKSTYSPRYNIIVDMEEK